MKQRSKSRELAKQGMTPRVYTKGILRFVPLAVSLCLMETAAFGQASFRGLGDPSGGDFRSLARDVSADGSVVVGFGTTADRLFEAFRWTVDSDIMDPLGIMPTNLVPGGSFAYGVSGDGQVVVGTSATMNDVPAAFQWTVATGMMTHLGNLADGGTTQEARAASVDGSVIVGWYFTRPCCGEQAFRWTKGSGATALGRLPGGNMSKAYDVSADGSVVVGFSNNATQNAEAFIWTANTATMRPLGFLPGGTLSRGIAVSNDGSVVAGWSNRAGTAQRAFRWTESDNVMVDLGVAPGSTISQATDVSGDGSIVVGISAGPFIWTQEDGMRDLKTVLETDYDLDLTGWSFLTADWPVISDDGNVIVGTGINPNGQHEAWRAVLSQTDLTVISPFVGELAVADTKHDILWASSPDIDSLLIEFSDDDGANYRFVAINVPADSNRYEWEVPFTLSTRCRIKITDVNNSNTFAESPLFKVKGYELTRFTSSGDYERFKPSKHAWSFDNRRRNLWPDTYFARFSYNGNDPNTGTKYPDEFLLVHRAKPSDFPPWELFVRAYGANQCYRGSPGNLTYRWSAVRKWAARKRDWRGSCAGFAISNFMAFDDSMRFRSKFRQVGNFQSLSSLPLIDDHRDIVNELWIYWSDEIRTDLVNLFRQTTPVQTLNDVKRMLLDEHRDDSYLYLRNTNGSGAHAVNPYKVTEDPANPDIERIHVLDNNSPTDATRMFIINKQTNTWSYTAFPHYGVGNHGLFLMDPISSYWGNAILPPPLAATNRQKSNTVSSNTANFISFYNSDQASVRITDSGGRSIGYADSVAFNNLNEGIPIIPITGFFHAPIGYYLPEDTYSIVMNEFGDSLTTFSVFTDSLIYSYERSNADFNQSDHISWKDGLGLCNHDAENKTITLEAMAVTEISDRVFAVGNMQLGNSDSLHLRVRNQTDLHMINAGAAKTYDLRLRSTSADLDGVFEYSGLTITTGASHQLTPDWQNLKDAALSILVDVESDGVIDDTLSVTNQVTSVANSPGSFPVAFKLEQNYPNPFNPETEIRFSVPEASHVVIRVFNTLGQEIAQLADSQYEDGFHRVRWDGKDKLGNPVASGIYLYQLQAGPFSQVRKMTLLR